MNFNFGEILSRAWQIIWKHKVFWIFGILASCSGGGPSFNVNYNFNSGDFNGGTPNIPPEIQRFFAFVGQNAVAIISITVALVCILWVIALFFGTVGRIGLIRGTGQIEAGESAAFGQLFSESLSYFWRVFGLSVLVSLPFLFVIGAMVAGFLVFGIAMARGSSTSALGILALTPLFLGCMCLLVPVGILVNLIVRQAERAIVLEDHGLLPALSRGWDIFRVNLGPIIIMALILAVIGLGVGFVIAIPVLIVVLPATLAFVAGAASGRAPNWTPMVIALACVCILSPFLWLARGILVSYVESAWTLTYMRLVKPQDKPPVIIEANA
ncbi:MAG: hypothetical protein ACM3XO_22320 [Bacteroidota bacterium]